MSQTQIPICECDNKDKIFIVEFERESSTLYCKNCIKDKSLTNSAIKITNALTGEVLKI